MGVQRTPLKKVGIHLHPLLLPFWKMSKQVGVVKTICTCPTAGNTAAKHSQGNGSQAE